MNGYLMQEREWTSGEDLFVESLSPENKYGVVFEDDGEAAYFYAVEKDAEGTGLRVLDALHINETDNDAPDDLSAGDGIPENASPGNDGAHIPLRDGPGDCGSSRLLIVWSKDWTKCALVIGGLCHAIFDFKEQSGYNINEFPPPNEFWSKGDRKMTAERLKNF